MRYAVIVRVDGQDRGITWADGVLSGDTVLIGMVREDAPYASILIRHPVGYRPPDGVEAVLADPYAVYGIAAALGAVVAFSGDDPTPYGDPGAIN
jgi:hypothetical protein